MFNGRMKRAVSVLAAIATAAVLVPATASAANVQIGVTTTPLVAPTCPANAQKGKCTIVLEQMTAFETLRDGIVDPDTIKQSGVISSFTLGLASDTLITPAIYASENQKYGGAPEAQITALVPTGTAAHPSYRVAAESELVKLHSEFGNVAEFPLVTPLPVVRGEILALTVPTWAPVLSFELDTTKFAYVQSRIGTEMTVKTATGTAKVSSCTTTSATNLAQIVVGELSGYGCSYPGSRIEYSALEITTPTGFNGETRKRLVVG
jgi:hypothetical protein